MTDKRNQVATNSFSSMSKEAKEALGTKTRKVFSALKPYYTQCHVVIRNDEQEASMMASWAKALIEAGVSEGMLRAGVNRAKRYASENQYCKWPNLRDFIFWCYELPEPEDAFYEASRHFHDVIGWEPSHPAVAVVFQSVSRTLLQGMTEKQAKSEYIRAYNKVCDRAIGGEKLEYTKREILPKIERNRTDQEFREAKENLSKIRGELGDSKPKYEPISDEEMEARKAKIREQAAKLKKGAKNESK